MGMFTQNSCKDVPGIWDCKVQVPPQLRLVVSLAVIMGYVPFWGGRMLYVVVLCWNAVQKEN